MPKQINTYQVGQSLVKKFGLKGRFQPVLDEVIVPVITVGDTTPTDIRLAVSGISAAAAGAGNQHKIHLRNPPNSGILMTVKSFWAVSGAPTTDFLAISMGTTSTAAGTRGFWRDGRIAGQPLGRLTIIQTPNFALTEPFYHLDNDDTQWYGDWILPEGGTFIVDQNADNTTLTLSVRWEEQDITASLGG